MSPFFLHPLPSQHTNICYHTNISCHTNRLSYQPTLLPTHSSKVTDPHWSISRYYPIPANTMILPLFLSLHQHNLSYQPSLTATFPLSSPRCAVHTIAVTLMMPLPGDPAIAQTSGTGTGIGAGAGAQEIPDHPVRQDVNKMFRARCWAELNQGKGRGISDYGHPLLTYQHTLFSHGHTLSSY